LTYSYTASAGQLTATGPTAKLSTAGLGATTITVTCNVVDDLGQSAQANTQVTLTVPPTPVVAETQDLCHISFERDHRRPLRVDNEAKGCLDDIALTMQQQAGATLVMVGNSSANEHPEAGAERALNGRQYLVKEKGIDSSRIEVRIGSVPGRFVSNTLVPPGAHFDGSTSRSFDENTIVRHGQAYGTPGASLHAAPHYRAHRSGAAHRSPRPVPGPLRPAPGSKSGSSTPPTGAKPGAHAKPSPATPMPAKPTQGKPAIKPSPHAEIQAKTGKPSPSTPMSQAIKKS
jgi:hypothetical protein